MEARIVKAKNLRVKNKRKPRQDLGGILDKVEKVRKGQALRIKVPDDRTVREMQSALCRAIRNRFDHAPEMSVIREDDNHVAVVWRDYLNE